MILLDAQMPGMDGFTCCAELKAILGELCPPIIMITGLSDKASVDRAFAVGAIDYTTKPIHIVVLKHRIRQVLRERELIHYLASVNQQLAEANRELQELTRIDGLTRIANHRYFQEILASEWQRLASQKKFLSLLLCDVDYFKQYNDYYGHLEGDRCLETISQLLAQSVGRSSDLVARYGGEEFVILLPDTEPMGAFRVAQRVHNKIKEAAIPHKGAKNSDILTISIGGAYIVPFVKAEPSSLTRVADQALYCAKEQGRNQTIFKEYFSLNIKV